MFDSLDLLKASLCSDNVAVCRDTVENSPVDNVALSDDMLICYMYEDDGRYHKYYLKGDLDNLARFICSCEKDKLVCDSSDYAIFNTMGYFLDKCSRIEKGEFQKLLDLVVSYQEQIESDGYYTSFLTSEGEIVEI